MSKIDVLEKEVIDAYESGVLRSTMPSKSELKALREAAHLRARALEEGVPYQTLIESVLHKFVAGRLVEKPARHRSRRAARKRTAG
ncbi:MAG: hypothetical protein ACREKH_20215 [Candidatus Rokuibacteriota bacterium]